MSYASMASLAKNPTFQERVKTAATIECQANLDNVDQPDWSNLAYDTLRGAPHVLDSFIRMTAQAPSVEAAAGDPPDQTAVADDLIKTVVNENYSIVTSLWYNLDGSPWSGGYIPAPIESEPEPPTSVISFSPTQGGNNALITVTGTGLSQATGITVGDPLTNMTVLDDSTVTGNVPSSINKGFYDVVVTVGGTPYVAPSGQFQKT